MVKKKSAGYSGTPLIKKLGIKAGARVAFVGAPAHYPDLLGALPDGVKVLTRVGKEMDFIHLFCTLRSDLIKRLSAIKPKLAQDGAIWISWPKGSSDIATDLSGGEVRNTGLAAGMVDIKVCAVDEDWSAHKFVIRVKDRRKT